MFLNFFNFVVFAYLRCISMEIFCIFITPLYNSFLFLYFHLTSSCSNHKSISFSNFLMAAILGIDWSCNFLRKATLSSNSCFDSFFLSADYLNNSLLQYKSFDFILVQRLGEKLLFCHNSRIACSQSASNAHLASYLKIFLLSGPLLWSTVLTNRGQWSELLVVGTSTLGLPNTVNYFLYATTWSKRSLI